MVSCFKCRGEGHLVGLNSVGKWVSSEGPLVILLGDHLVPYGRRRLPPVGDRARRFPPCRRLSAARLRADHISMRDQKAVVSHLKHGPRGSFSGHRPRSFPCFVAWRLRRF